MQTSDCLTPREQEVLALVAEGHTNREIADILVISEYTVQNHLSNIYDKLEVTSRIQAVRMTLLGSTGQETDHR